MRVKKRVAAVLMAAAAMISLTACDDSKPVQTERASVDGTYEGLVANQPAQTMKFSPTRATKNFWIQTWDQPGKLSYVYLQAADGKLLGYYVLEGLPVSYCTSLVPTYQAETHGANDSAVVMPRPSVDGTYSSGSNCSTYYGKDALTGAYIEYTAGMGINVLLFDQPMPNLNAQPLGQTKIEDVK